MRNGGSRAIKRTLKRRTGRSRIDTDVEQLIVRMAKENVSWSYARIQGALEDWVITPVEQLFDTFCSRTV